MRLIAILCLMFVFAWMTVNLHGQETTPVITFSKPSPQHINSGSTLTFSVTATASTGTIVSIRYTNQWPRVPHFDEALGWSGVSTATVSCTRTAPFGVTEVYDLIIYARVWTNAPASKVMRIVVSGLNTVPFVLTNFAQINGSRCFEIRGSVPSGMDRIIEASTNLVDWVAIGTNGWGELSNSFCDLDAAAFPRRFYRVGWQ